MNQFWSQILKSLLYQERLYWKTWKRYPSISEQVDNNTEKQEDHTKF